MKITVEILERVIGGLPEVFDTHKVIEALMREAPRHYADDLGATPGADPIHDYHAAIGRLLLRIEHIEKTDRVSSRNVRGNETENQEWRKR